DTIAHSAYGAFLGSMGRFDEAFAGFAKSDSIAPSLTNDTLTCRAYYSMRQFGKAEEACKRSLAKGDNVIGHLYLGFSYLAEGKNDPAVAEMEALQHFSKNAGGAAALAYVCATVGQKDRALDLMKTLLAGGVYGKPPPYRMAAVYLALGDKPTAPTWLE